MHGIPGSSSDVSSPPNASQLYARRSHLPKPLSSSRRGGDMIGLLRGRSAALLATALVILGVFVFLLYNNRRVVLGPNGEVHALVRTGSPSAIRGGKAAHNSAAGSVAAITTRESSVGEALPPVDDADNVMKLVAQVQRHLQSVRNRMQDRPGAPQVLSLAGGAGVGGAVLGQGEHLLPLHLNPDAASEDTEDADGTIFVSMAAFRDVECGPTLEDMFRKAKYPHRIFVGIVDQREGGEYRLCIPQSFIDCQSSPLNTSWSGVRPKKTGEAPASADGKTSSDTWNSTKSTFCPMDNIRIRHTLPNEARGPTFGRFVAQLMYQGEQYYMMIDSHMRFVERWDVRLLRMYSQLQTRGVISHYPSGFEPGFVLESNHDIMFMCYAHYYDGVGILRNGAKNVRNRQKRPVLQPFTAAGFLFGHSDYIFDVPFDPWLDYLFDGEEILYTVRLWTSGWDSYLPSHDIMYHFYGRPKAPKVWGTTNQWVATQRVSQRRVLHLLKMTKANSTIPVVDPATETEKRIFNEIDKYGLGSVRRIEDFWPFAHVDPIKRTSDRGFCDRAN